MEIITPGNHTVLNLIGIEGIFLFNVLALGECSSGILFCSLTFFFPCSNVFGEDGFHTSFLLNQERLQGVIKDIAATLEAFKI